MIAMDRQNGIEWREKKGVEKAGLAKHIRQMRSCRNKTMKKLQQNKLIYTVTRIFASF